MCLTLSFTAVLSTLLCLQAYSCLSPLTHSLPSKELSSIVLACSSWSSLKWFTKVPDHTGSRLQFKFWTRIAGLTFAVHQHTFSTWYSFGTTLWSCTLWDTLKNQTALLFHSFTLRCLLSQCWLHLAISCLDKPICINHWFQSCLALLIWFYASTLITKS